ncbi:NADPH2:quinone reductase [Seiridium cupressi]
MKAIVLHAHGGPESLSYEEVPDPIPAANEVLIRVIATALNHVDIDVRNGTSGVESSQSLPHVPGVDAVGVQVSQLSRRSGVDVAFDGIGGQILKDCIQCLTDGGRIASIGAHGGEVVDIDMIQFFRKHLTMHGCGRSTRGTMAKVLDLMARRKLVPIVDRKYPLRQAKDAHEVMEGREFCGRILLLPNCQ